MTTKLISILFLAICMSGRSAPIGFGSPHIGGLVGHWTFNEASGTTSTADLSGLGRIAFLTNSPTWTNGVIGPALRFNGTSQMVKAESQNLTNMTVACFLRRESANGCMIGRQEAAPFRHNYYLMIVSGKLLFGFYNGSTYPSLTYDATIPLNTWTHVAATTSVGVISIYVNGVMVTNSASNGSPAPATGLSLGIGANVGQVTDYLGGHIDDVRIYNRALTADEIKLLYGGGYGRAQ